MRWFHFYAGCIMFLCVAAGLVLSLPQCSRRFKFLQSSCAYAVTFGSIITFCVIPFTHAAIVKGVSSEEFRMCGGYFLMLMLYATGCVFYLLKMPECFFPGKFDYFGGSHNLFHIFIVMAAFAHYATNFRFLELRCQQRMAGLHA
jgi:adiponectin receptor